MQSKSNDFRVKTSRQVSKRPQQQTSQQGVQGVSQQTLKKKLSPIRLNKFNVFMDCLNDLTQQKFEKCQSRIMFQQIEEKVKKNQLLCILFIQNVTVYNKYDLPNNKIPPKFSWEAIYRGKTLILTTPHQYTKTCHGVVDFMFKSNAKYPLKLKLLKVKNYEEQYIGEIDLSVSDFVDFEVVQEYQGKMIKETFVQKEMFKVYNDQWASIGQVSLKIIQFCSSSVPSNKSSNIPGSPKTLEQRKKHQQIEEAKLKGFDWGSSKDEEIIIQLILECQKDMAGKIKQNMEEVQERILQMESFLGGLLKESCYADDIIIRRRALTRMKRLRQDLDGIISGLLKQSDPAYQEILGQLRLTSRQGRIKKFDIESALVHFGCDAAKLLILTVDDFGMCLIDYMLDSDSLPELLYFFNQLGLNEDVQLEVFAQSLFENIKQRLRKNHYLKALACFINALHIYPNIGLIIAQYATNPQNSSILVPFLLEFNIQDYQHVIVLSKLRKLCQKFLNPELPFMKSIEELYGKAKQETYFKIPILPKKVETQQKFDLLQLPELQQNIFHEIVRRKRWNLFARSWKQFEQFVYQKDNQGISPMMMFLENAPLDQILNLDSLQNQTSLSGQTSLHFLIMNPDLSINSLYACINKFNMINDKVWLGFTPLALFLDRLLYKQKKHKSRIIKELKAAQENNSNKGVPVLDILSLSAINFIKHFNFNKYLLYCQNIKKDYFFDDFKKLKLNKPFQIQQQKNKQITEWDNFYYQHTIPAMILCKLDESIQELIWQQFDWINWLCSKQNYPYETYYNQTLMVSIAKTTQTQYIYQYLTKDVQIIYKDNDQFSNDKNNTFDFLPIFQSIYQIAEITTKLKDDIQKKYKGISDINKKKEEEDENQNKINKKKEDINHYILLHKNIKQMQQNLAQQKYQQVLDQLMQEQQNTEGLLKNNFKYQGIVNDLMIAKSLNFGKFFRKAYDSKFHDMLNFVDILLKALHYNNMQAAHMALFFAQLRMNKCQRVAQLKNNQQVYLQSLNTHWSIELDFGQFQAMINDIKDICQQNEVNYVILILAMNGRYNKLKLIHDRMTNQNYIIQALPIAAHQINTVRKALYYENLNKLLQECDVKRLYPEDNLDFFKPPKDKEKLKPDPKKPFDKAKPVFQKWIMVQSALTTQLQQIYKYAANSYQRVKSEFSILQKQYQLLWYQEYSYKLRRLFPRQNFRSVFYSSKQKESDFVKTIELLIEKVLQLKLTPSDDFFTYVHVHDKFSELLSQSPNQNVCIVQAFKSMINLFQYEQSNDVLIRCINFLKKYLNSKIFKDLNEPDTFRDESQLLTKYLSKSDPLSTQCKFACEVLILMDQNFTTQEFETLNLIQQPQQLASLLLKYKTLEKRTLGFIQKYLNSSNNQAKQALPFNESNMKYIVDLAKQGINLINENALEFFITKGLFNYLKDYFLSSLKPKGMLSDDQKQFYLGFAFSSGSQETIQLCLEDLCSLKSSELKQFMLEGNLLSRAIAKGSQETLLYITRKIMKQLSFNGKEILKLLLIQDNVAEPFQQDKQKRSLFTTIFLLNYDIFYKEFFVDYLQKILPQEYKNIMTKILNATVCKLDENNSWSVFQLAINCGFYDVIQTVLQLNISIERKDLEEVQISNLPQRWLFQTPQQLENLLKQEHYKQLYKQSALRLYRICKYHLCRQEKLKELEICLNLVPLYNKIGLQLESRDPIINIIMNQEIDPAKQPLIYLLKLHLDQVDKANSFILVESFCDKHPQITHDKIYTQLIKNREAYELLRIYYPEQNEPGNANFDFDLPYGDNIVKEYLLLQDPYQFIRFITTNQQLIFSLRVLYDKNDDLDRFYDTLIEPQHVIVSGILLLILNPNKHTEVVHNKFKQIFELRDDPSASQVTNIFRAILRHFQTIERTFIFFFSLIQSLLNNQIYQQLIQIKPIGDMNNQISSEKQFLEDIKDALIFNTFTLQDNVWGQILGQSTKVSHQLQSDKWFQGLCLIKSLLHVCYQAEVIIHEIQTLSKLDDYISIDFWGVQSANIEIRAELHPSEQVAQHKVIVFKQSENNTWKIKYPLGMVKDTQFIYPSILSSQKGTEHAKNQLIQQVFEQTKYDILPKIENFTFESYSYENIQQLIMETHDNSYITHNPYTFQGDSIQYNGKQLISNYSTKKKNKKELILIPITNQIIIQVVSKDEFIRREKYSFLFNQIIEDSSTKYWTYLIDKENIQSIKDDQMIMDLYEMTKDRLGYHVQFQSFVECYYNKLANGIEKATKKSISPKICVDIALQWDMLIKVIKHIASYIKFTDNICFEMAEIDQRKSINIKLEGFDSIFRFGQAELSISNNILVVKLNIAMLTNGNFQQLLQTQNRSKQNTNEIKESIDIQQYLLSIFNEQQLSQL
ncbi:unnamed protein product [Paramecium sonneborni]|uniref:Uncharacterized protein n=1 Tax=Paramecium sonneborni TaxID=65129 RepID=A0A8S1M8C6_9CILI|nr:unnamed protein product [Paramecium sonneborni]